jgi:hypothetical protein
MGKHGLGTASCHFLESGRIDTGSLGKMMVNQNVHQAEIDASCD